MKNTGLKIVHRMTAQDDRNTVGSTMSATSAQLEYVGTFEEGDALIFYEGLQLPFRGKIKQWGKKYTGELEFSTLPKSDKELAGLMIENEFYRSAMEAIVDALVIKLQKTLIAKIGDFFDEAGKFQIDYSSFEERRTVMNGGQGIIAPDKKEESASAFRERFQALTLKLIACGNDIGKANRGVGKLAKRFPLFREKLKDVEQLLINADSIYNDRRRDFVDLKKKLYG
jgi:hypothetical protein